MRGWIKLHRRLTEHFLWKCESFSRGQAWVDLLLLANHAEGAFMCRGIEVRVRRGEVAHSESTLALRWKWSRTKVRNFLKLLEKEQQIEQQKNNVTTLIKITNYDLYNSEEQQKFHQSGQQKDSRSTAEEQQKDTNKNEENEKPVENYKEESSSSSAGAEDLRHREPLQPGGDDDRIPFSEVVELHTACFAKEPASTLHPILEQIRNEFPASDVREAFAKATVNGAQRLSYVKTCLERMTRERQEEAEFYRRAQERPIVDTAPMPDIVREMLEFQKNPPPEPTEEQKRMAEEARERFRKLFDDPSPALPKEPSPDDIPQDVLEGQRRLEEKRRERKNLLQEEDDVREAG